MTPGPWHPYPADTMGPCPICGEPKIAALHRTPPDRAPAPLSGDGRFLSRNVVIPNNPDGMRFQGEWIAIPREDYDAARDALDAARDSRPIGADAADRRTNQWPGYPSEFERRARDSRPVGEGTERIFVSPERIEAAVESLGPTGDLAEAYVKVAALAAVHVLRGGRIEYIPPTDQPASTEAGEDG